MYLLRFASQAIMEELLVIPGLPVFYPQVLPCSLHFISDVFFWFVLPRWQGAQGQAYLLKREDLYHKVSALRACSALYALMRRGRSLQGSDASNAHDEEVGEHEQASLALSTWLDFP
jgi:hypothetical protein